jgi:hypothetical protein
MGPVVFAQARSGRLDLAKICANARNYFRLELDILREEPPRSGGADPEVSRTEIALRGPSAHVRFVVLARPATADDLERARRAEAISASGGMSLLAERCDYIWALEVPPEVDEANMHMLCALLASVALGPVLPADGLSLYGVRGARERALRAARKSE